jgi:hypothetical protein
MHGYCFNVDFFWKIGVMKCENNFTPIKETQYGNVKSETIQIR